MDCLSDNFFLFLALTNTKTITIIIHKQSAIAPMIIINSTLPDDPSSSTGVPSSANVGCVVGAFVIGAEVGEDVVG